jgi:signal transduction histidine kinase
MMRSIRNMSLGIKFTLIILTVLAVAVSATMVLLNWSATRLMEQAGREQLKSEAAAIQTSLTQAEVQTLHNAKLLATLPGLVEAVTARDPNAVRTIVLTTAAAAMFDEIEVVDADGNSLTAPATGDESSGAPAIHDMLSLGLLGTETTGIVASPGESKLMLGGVTPMRDRQGNIVGALIASQNLDEEFLAAIALRRDDIHLALVHRGEIVAFTEAYQDVISSFNPRLVEEARNGRIAVDDKILYNPEGTPYVQAIIPMGTRKTTEGTFIAASVDLRRLRSFQRQIFTFLGISTGLASLALMGMIALFAWRNISVPLRRLQTVAGAMAGGDFHQRFDVRGLDEVGQLGRAFNTMAGAIRLRDRSLTEANETLEKRVRDRTQQLEQANREAREASRLKDEFLAIMSHELRTPLNAIIGFQGILEMMGDLSEKNLLRVKRTRANAERLLHLIDDVLDISRIESGRLQIVPSYVYISDLMDGLRKQMDVLADEKGLRFDVQIDDDVPEAIWVDEDGITKILTNLLGNAFKFTAEGGVSLRIQRADGTWQIQVQDTGIGIPAHMHEIIFERFRQVDGSTKREYGGTGLGLAIARQLAAAMGGTIRVDSALGEGATFTVTLPLESEPESVLKPVPAL